MTGSPSPITWKDLERQIRRRCREGGLRGRVTVTPWTAAEERAAAVRDHAYVYPADLDFHFSSKTLALPEKNRDAVVDHEVGHCLAQHHWNSSTEDEADAAAQQWLGTKICYDPRWHGKGLQVVCSRAANPAPDFETYDEALAWVDRKAKEYGGKNNFLSSDEYREAYSKIVALHAAGHRVYTAGKQDELVEAGLRSGDRVSSTTQGIFGPGEPISGTITMRKGVPWVKLDEPTAVSVEGRVSVRSSVRWSPRWQKLERNPSTVRRGTPPPVLSGYLMRSEIDARYRGVYFVGDTQIASSRTTPAPSSIPVGTWRYDDQFKGLYGHEIDELVEIDPHDLELSEFIEEQFREGLKASGKLEDAERYAQWLAEGNEMPPVTVLQTDSDTFKLSDGHRRTYAAMLAGKPVRAWMSWNAPHPEGLVDAYGRPMKVGLTYEIATGRMANREQNPRQQRISRRITSAGL